MENHVALNPKLLINSTLANKKKKKRNRDISSRFAKSRREKKNTGLLCSVLKDSEKRKGTSSSQGQADKWERFKRRNRQRARIFHRREKGGALATLSNCIPTFVGKAKDGVVREVEKRDGA